jgi:hypothetical protein
MSEHPSWVIEQRWSEALFLNWKVDPAQIQDRVPFALDLHEGKAVVSVVPFYMSRIRFPWTPVVPGVSNLWELNLRTYVTHEGQRGIYFFTLDSSSRIGNWIARTFFKLPYRYAQMKCSVDESRYELDARGDRYGLRIRSALEPETLDPEFQRWVTERYHLFLSDRGKVIRGDVSHAPWKARAVRVLECTGEFSDLAGIRLERVPDSAYFASPLQVRFAPFVSIGKLK